jgi:hypothetical protein
MGIVLGAIVFFGSRDMIFKYAKAQTEPQFGLGELSPKLCNSVLDFMILKQE